MNLHQFSTTIRIPAEWEQHTCCWMAWAVHSEWGSWADVVKDELAAVIQTIAKFEPVRLLTSAEDAGEAVSRFSGISVKVVEAPVDDIWMRDIAPTFALRGTETVGIDFNFNGWGNSRLDRPGDRLAMTANTTFKVPRISAGFTAEGGALITDGEGTLITTESCLLNRNRNTFGSKENRKRTIERGLEKFGIRRVIWLKGDSREPITNGHIDAFAMFTAPGTLLVESADDNNSISPEWRERDIATLNSSKDACGRNLRIEGISAPRKRYWAHKGKDWAPCYLNAYVANGAVIAPCFGDPVRDETAKDALVRAFPGRTIQMLRIDHIAGGGGGIHCLTQPMVETKRASA